MRISVSLAEWLFYVVCAIVVGAGILGLIRWGMDYTEQQHRRDMACIANAEDDLQLMICGVNR